MNCEVCHKEVIEYTSKSGRTYNANPFDKSPHRVRDSCVNDWDGFMALSKKVGYTDPVSNQCPSCKAVSNEAREEEGIVYIRCLTKDCSVHIFTKSA